MGDELDHVVHPDGRYRDRYMTLDHRIVELCQQGLHAGDGAALINLSAREFVASEEDVGISR